MIIFLSDSKVICAVKAKQLHDNVVELFEKLNNSVAHGHGAKEFIAALVMFTKLLKPKHAAA